MLAAWPQRVEGGPQGEVQGDQVLAGTHNAVEVKTELSEVVVLDRELELGRVGNTEVEEG